MSFAKKLTVVGGLVCAAVVTFATTPVLAQGEAYSTQGKIFRAAPGLITIQEATGKQVKIKVVKPGEDEVDIGGNQRLKNVTLDLSITAHYSPDNILEGSFVQFITYLNDKGFAQGVVKEITVFDPTQAGRTGITEALVGGDAPEGTTAFIVKGITAGPVRRGQVIVTVPKGAATPKGKIRITIDDDAAVTAYSEKLEHAMPGDDIEVEGFKYGTTIIGTKVVIVRNAAGAKDKPSGIAGGDKKPDAGKGPAGNRDSADDKVAENDRKRDKPKTDDDEKRDGSERVLIIN